MEINKYLEKNAGSQDVAVIASVLSQYSAADWAQEGGDPCLPVPWSWVRCNSDPQPRITAILLSNKNLTGNIPSDFTKLSGLVEIWFDGNSLTGPIPDFSQCLGHTGCVNAVAWNSRGSLLISGSDDTQVNIWCYSTRKLLHSIDSGHTANILCTKLMPETSDELVASGAGDAEVRLFNLSRISGSETDDHALPLSALFEYHTRRVKKLAVEVGNPNVVWSASEDGTLRQHDIRLEHPSFIID